jgi:ADP-ribose pyrophosphatase
MAGQYSAQGERAPMSYDNPDESHNPWTTRSVQTRYENPWIRVDHHDVLTPAGTAGIYGVVNFKNLAIGVVPLDAEGYTWVVGQYRYAMGEYSWEIPEGGGPLGDTPLASAQRELREEVGLEAARWDKILEMDLSNSVTNEKAIIYVARDLSMHEAHPEETEQLALRRIPFEQLYQEVRAGKHRDSLTVAAVMRIKLMQLEGTL